MRIFQQLISADGLKSEIQEVQEPHRMSIRNAISHTPLRSQISYKDMLEGQSTFSCREYVVENQEPVVLLTYREVKDK